MTLRSQVEASTVALYWEPRGQNSRQQPPFNLQGTSDVTQPAGGFVSGSRELHTAKMPVQQLPHLHTGTNTTRSYDVALVWGLEDNYSRKASKRH